MPAKKSARSVKMVGKSGFGHVGAVWRENACTTWTLSSEGTIRWNHETAGVDQSFDRDFTGAVSFDGSLALAERSMWDVRNDETKWLCADIRGGDWVGSAFIDETRVVFAQKSSFYICDRHTGTLLETKHVSPREITRVTGAGGRWAYSTRERLVIHSAAGVDEQAVRTTALAISPSGCRLAYATSDAVRVLSAIGGEAKMTLVADFPSREVAGIGFLGETLFVCAKDGAVFRCDVDSFVSVGQLPGETEDTHVTFTPFGPIRTNEITVEIFNEAFELQTTLGLFGYETNVKRISPERALMFSLTTDGQRSHYSAQLWNTKTVRPLVTIADRTLAFDLPFVNETGGKIGFFDEEQTLRVFDTESGAKHVEISLWEGAEEFWERAPEVSVGFGDADHVIVASPKRAWSIDATTGSVTLVPEPAAALKQLKTSRRKKPK